MARPGLCALVLLLAAGTNLAAQVKEHQATGIVASASPVQIVLLKKFGANETKWTFVVNAKTKVDTKPAKGMRLRIYYHEDRNTRIDDRIKAVPAPRTKATTEVPQNDPTPTGSSPSSPTFPPQK